jgi:hypothetical protein
VNGLEFVIIIVFLSMIKGTVHKYLDYRMRIADRQVSSGDRGVMRAIEEIRAEVAALKRHETDTILSFDSTLQTLDARVKHLERGALGDGAAERASANVGQTRHLETGAGEASAAAPIVTGQASHSQ